MAPKILLTGAPGVGKTTVVLRLVEMLGADAVGGFFTRELRDESGARVGFEVADFRGGRAIMARKGLASPYRVGSYGVDVDAIERIALPAVERALSEGKIIVADELGKMEFFSEALVSLMWRAMESSLPLVATVMLRPHPVADRFKRAPGVEVVVVSAKNREALPPKIFGKLKNFRP